MTLIELLIVIVILATLTAAALPILTPTTDGRRIREASRELNSYISQAQAKAIATQRPYGVALKRLSTDTGRAEDRGACVEVFMVEQPAPYAGFDENSRVRVALNVPDDSTGNRPVGGYDSIPTVLIQFVTRGTMNGDNLPDGWDVDLMPTGVLRPCDEITIAGTRYEILSPTQAIPRTVQLLPLDTTTNNVFFRGDTSQPPRVLIAQPLNDTGQVLKPVADNRGLLAHPTTGVRLNEGWWDLVRTGVIPPGEAPEAPYWSDPVPYGVQRQPTPTSAPPFQLPEGTAIDLQASGPVGDLPLHPDLPGLVYNDQPIFIMFSPEGSVERLQYTCPFPSVFLQANVAASISPGLQGGRCCVVRPTSNISLLIGRRELIPVDTNLDLTGGTEADREEAKNQLNWLNLESRWVTIGAQTGNVVTTENAFVDPATIPANDYDRDGDVDGSDLETRMGQIQTAQEFVREMRRLGGR